MLIAHLPAGYLLAKGVSFGRRARRVLFLGVVAGSILPDLDMVYFHLIDYGLERTEPVTLKALLRHDGLLRKMPPEKSVQLQGEILGLHQASERHRNATVTGLAAMTLPKFLGAEVKGVDTREANPDFLNSISR